jgi:hypothetical protein
MAPGKNQRAAVTRDDTVRGFHDVPRGLRVVRSGETEAAERIAGEAELADGLEAGIFGRDEFQATTFPANVRTRDGSKGGR